MLWLVAAAGAIVQQLEALFQASSPSSPDRPAVARRLAESYAELTRVGDDATASASHRSAIKYPAPANTVYPDARGRQAGRRERAQHAC